MTTLQDTTVDTLHHLLMLNRDSAEAYHQAANGTQHPRIKALLLQCAEQYETFCADLETAIVRCGGTPEPGGRPLAALQRGWRNL
ncbi:MAG: DUF2383 domain-containing protein, partial [Chloroflexaceae bacterium]|nr:DUF2383 domain-containing protein [Chloroflexaceae bacterium]